MKKIFRGTIKNWQIHTLTTGDQLFTGTVVNDPTRRFEVGWHMRSSVIIDFIREVGLVETENSLYMLDISTENGDTFGDLGNDVLKIWY